MAAKTGMFQATRLLLHTTFRRLPSVTPAVERCSATQIITHPIPIACFHTHQRLHQDDTTTEPGGAGHKENSEVPSPEKGKARSTGDVLAELGLGTTYISPTSSDSLVFNGVPFDKLHIVHIKASYNNTIISLSDYKGRVVKNVSAGTEGFKNARQGTSVAGQTVGTAAAKVALAKGIKTVRVLIKGIGPGRQTSIKGLQLGGLDVVSITDRTGIPQNGDKPRKAPRR